MCLGDKQALAAVLLKGNKTESQRVSGRRGDTGRKRGNLQDESTTGV